MENQQGGLTMWNSVLTSAMSIPGVKVDRATFLMNSFSAYCDRETLLGIVDMCPSAYLPEDLIDRVANDVINGQTTKVTFISAAAGIPGGLAMIGTIPGDIAQYYYHTFIIAQKLAYLYGYPSLTDGQGRLSDEAKNQLTIFVGVMSGVSLANEALNTLARGVSEQVAKKLAKMAISNTVVYKIVEKVAKVIGVKINKEIFARGAAKVIPLLGALTSATLTYASFRPSAKKFQTKLKENLPCITAPYRARLDNGG